MLPATRVAPPSRTPCAWWRTHWSAAGSASAWNDQAALHRYSRTWTKSMRIGTFTLRVRASAWIRSIWWLLPSTSATQVRVWWGSRRSASSKIAATMAAASWATLAVSHLLCAVGPRVASRRWVSPAGQDVGWGAGNRCGVVDRPNFSHPFTASFLAFGQPGRQLRVGRRGGLGGRRSEGIRAHDDALAVAGQHQDVAIVAGGCLPLGVEGVEA